MATAAQTVIYKAAILLQDLTAVRWDANELVTWLNDGQREIVTFRPDATSQYVTGTLQAGARQSLDIISETAALKPFKLLDITRNMASSSQLGAVTEIKRDVLDTQNPTWYGLAGSIDIVHFTFDERTPRQFFVYPPALNTAQIEIEMSSYPTDVTVPASGTTYASVSGNIGVADIYANALLDYVMFRAYLKDNEFVGTAQKAAAHYQAFANAMGIELKATAANSPVVKDPAV